MSFHSEESWVEWFDRLSNDGYCVVEDFLSEYLYAQVRRHFIEKMSDDAFSKAGIGSSLQHQFNTEIRADRNLWLDRKKDFEIHSLFELLEETRKMLNRYCYLSLSDYEFQFALYPPGSFYKKHLDQFRERSNRMISLVVYLNENWNREDGGEIRIFKEDGHTDVEPIARRAILFRSDTIEHEVLRTAKPRYSISGWFLYQPFGLELL